MMNIDDKIKILEANVKMRERDVFERQIDIDNHKLSIELIDKKYYDYEDILDYKPKLQELLRSAILEQTKVKIFLEAAKMSLAAAISAKMADADGQ